MTDDEPRETAAEDQAAADADAAAGDAEAPTPIELTEAALEALLFVAERPLDAGARSRALAGVDRETVDARLGDLEVSLARPRHPARRRRRPRRAGDRARGRRARRPLRRRRRGPAVAGGARDARDRRLPPAGHEGRDRADPRRRLRLHDPGLLHRRLVVELGRSDAPGPAVPVRHRLRVPRAVRADQPRRAAAARRRRRGAPGRGGRRSRRRGRREAGQPRPARRRDRPRPTTPG